MTLKLSAAERKLMHLGGQVVYAERVFGKESPQYERAVAAWRAQQKKVGV